MSLLLDALKKAALEKQRREQTNAQTGNSVPNENPPEQPKKPKIKTEEVKSDAEKISQENLTVTAATIAATKIDLSQLNPELETLSIAEPYQTQAETNLSIQGDNLVFDISEIDPAYLEPSAYVEPSADSQHESMEKAPYVLPGTGIVEEFVRRAHGHQEDHGSLSVLADEPASTLMDKPQHQPVVIPDEPNQPQPSPVQMDMAPMPSETPAPDANAAQTISKPGNDNPLYTEDIKALFDGKAKPVEMFSASAGKEAMAQLLARSKKAANGARRRMMLMYAFLSVTAILMVVFYYYLLHSEAPTTVALVPEASVPVTNESAEAATEPTVETTPEIAESTEQAAVSEPDVTASINESDVAEGSLTTAPNAEQHAKRASEQPSQQAQPRAVVRKAPAPVQDSANHYVLPPESVPKQAMIVERNPAVNAVSEAIDRGYKAYQRGDISAAAEAYQEALRQDPYQRDAMLGAAAVAVRQGRQQDALKIYQQRLARDPKDQYAQSGILALSENADENPELDSELSRLLTEYPDASHLHFLKGSLYAARQQWAAAQVSFFEAWQRDNKNPDLAFNLAVALDHLAQPKEAARFYRQALTLGDSRPASFSVNAIQRRLQDLEGAAP